MKLKLDRETLKQQAQLHGKRGAAFAVKSLIIYAVMTVIGLIGGGIGGGWAAHHYDLATWLVWLSTLLGIAAGGVIMFIGAQLVVMDMIQEMILDAGIEAGKAGYKHAKAKLAERGQTSEKPAGSPDKLT